MKKKIKKTNTKRTTQCQRTQQYYTTVNKSCYAQGGGKYYMVINGNNVRCTIRVARGTCAPCNVLHVLRTMEEIAVSSLAGRLKKQVAHGGVPTASIRMGIMADKILCEKCGTQRATMFRELRLRTTRANVLRFVIRCRECHSGAWHVSKNDVLRTERRAEAFAWNMIKEDRVDTSEERLDIIEWCLEYAQIIELELAKDHPEFGTVYETNGAKYVRTHVCTCTVAAPCALCTQRGL